MTGGERRASVDELKHRAQERARLKLQRQQERHTGNDQTVEDIKRRAKERAHSGAGGEAPPRTHAPTRAQRAHSTPGTSGADSAFDSQLANFHAFAANKRTQHAVHGHEVLHQEAEAVQAGAHAHTEMERERRRSSASSRTPSPPLIVSPEITSPVVISLPGRKSPARSAASRATRAPPSASETTVDWEQRWSEMEAKCEAVQAECEEVKARLADEREQRVGAESSKADLQRAMKELETGMEQRLEMRLERQLKQQYEAQKGGRAARMGQHRGESHSDSTVRQLEREVEWDSRRGRWAPKKSKSTGNLHKQAASTRRAGREGTPTRPTRPKPKSSTPTKAKAATPAKENKATEAKTTPPRPRPPPRERARPERGDARASRDVSVSPRRKSRQRASGTTQDQRPAWHNSCASDHFRPSRAPRNCDFAQAPLFNPSLSECKGGWAAPQQAAPRGPSARKARRQGWVAVAPPAEPHGSGSGTARRRHPARRDQGRAHRKAKADDPNLAARCYRRARLMEARLNGITRKTGAF